MKYATMKSHIERTIKKFRKDTKALLKDNLIVLVADKGNIKGIISKSDLLGRIE